MKQSFKKYVTLNNFLFVDFVEVHLIEKGNLYANYSHYQYLKIKKYCNLITSR